MTALRPVPLTLSEVCQQVGVSRWTLRRWVRANTFPANTHVFERRPRWSSSVVAKWIDAQRVRAGEEQGR